MSGLALSNFKRTQVIFEIKFDSAHLLWDRAGALWRALGSHFKQLKVTRLPPKNR